MLEINFVFSVSDIGIYFFRILISVLIISIGGERGYHNIMDHFLKFRPILYYILHIIILIG